MDDGSDSGYVYLDTAGDQYVGWVVLGLPICHPKFASSTTSVWLLCTREWRVNKDSDAKYFNSFDKCR